MDTADSLGTKSVLEMFDIWSFSFLKALFNYDFIGWPWQHRKPKWPVVINHTVANMMVQRCTVTAVSSMSRHDSPVYVPTLGCLIQVMTKSNFMEVVINALKGAHEIKLLH